MHPRRLRMRYVSQELNSIRKSLTMIVLYRKVMVRNILIWHFIHSTMQPLYESQNVTQFYNIVADPGGGVSGDCNPLPPPPSPPYKPAMYSIKNYSKVKMAEIRNTTAAVLAIPCHCIHVNFFPHFTSSSCNACTVLTQHTTLCTQLKIQNLTIYGIHKRQGKATLSSMVTIRCFE